MSVIPYVVLGVLVVLAFVGIVAAVWVPPRQAAKWKDENISPADLAKIENDTRAAILQGIGGLALVGTLALTVYQVYKTQESTEKTFRISEKTFRNAERGQVAERFAKAVEQLGARNPKDGKPATEIRTGALLSLVSLGLETEEKRDSSFAALVAASYIANNIRQPGPGSDPSGTFASGPCSDERQDDRVPLPAEVHIAMTEVLPALSEQVIDDVPGARAYQWKDVDFSGTRLANLVFSGAQLQRVFFRNADLRKANFSRTTLTHVDFRGACLMHATLQNLSVSGKKSDLRGANLVGAEIDEALLQNALIDETTIGVDVK